MAATFHPGDIGLSTGTGWEDTLIKAGQHLHGDGPASKWCHAFVVVDDAGGTVEAQARGVVRMNVSDHPESVILPCPPGVDADKAVAFAVECLRDAYDFIELGLMGIDCVAHTLFHEHTDAWICSELAAAAWVAGGWRSPRVAALMMPADLYNAAKGIPTP